MTLEEAKRELHSLVKEYMSCSVIGLDMQVDVRFGEDRCKAIDTVLKALEDSMPKEKVREKIKELGKDIPMMTPRYFDWDSGEVIELLKELLGE